jgi:hypothetical protein
LLAMLQLRRHPLARAIPCWLQMCFSTSYARQHRFQMDAYHTDMSKMQWSMRYIRKLDFRVSNNSPSLGKFGLALLVRASSTR